MNVLITGSKGQLGQEFSILSQAHSNFNFFFTSSSELDITNHESVVKYIKQNKINIILNCAAYTAVDKAETEESIARKVNINGVENLINALPSNGKMIHFSTDYVFNGENFKPYKETEKVNPIGIYGGTKQEGENYIIRSKKESIVIRTSWVYSSFGKNFVKTMLKLGEERDELGVVFDQIGTPTYARDLARACLQIITNNIQIDELAKVYNYSNEGVASWYDFAKAIMELGNIDCNVKPIETKDFPTPAKRPNYSLLNKSKIKKDFEIDIPYWRDSLKECIKYIKLNV